MARMNVTTISAAVKELERIGYRKGPAKHNGKATFIKDGIDHVLFLRSEGRGRIHVEQV